MCYNLNKSLQINEITTHYWIFKLPLLIGDMSIYKTNIVKKKKSQINIIKFILHNNIKLTNWYNNHL